MLLLLLLAEVPAVAQATSDVHTQILAWIGLNSAALVIMAYSAGGWTNRIKNAEADVAILAHKIEAIQSQSKEIGALGVRVENMCERLDEVSASIASLRSELIRLYQK